MLGRELTIDDLKVCAIWPGRVNRNGKVVTPFLTLEKYLHVVEQIKWHNTQDGYHKGTIPQHLRGWLGMPAPRTKNPWQCLVHQLIYRLANGEWPTASIDHIDNCKQHNIPKNLRIATCRVQSKNRLPRADGRERGVYFEKDCRKWRVKICDAQGVRRYYGLYKTLEQANAVAAKIHEENAKDIENECRLIAAGEIPAKRDLPVGVVLSGSLKNPFQSRIKAGESGKRNYCCLGSYSTTAEASVAYEAAKEKRQHGCRDHSVLKQAARDAVERLREQCDHAPQVGTTDDEGAKIVQASGGWFLKELDGTKWLGVAPYGSRNPLSSACCYEIELGRIIDGDFDVQHVKQKSWFNGVANGFDELLKAINK